MAAPYMRIRYQIRKICKMNLHLHADSLIIKVIRRGEAFQQNFFDRPVSARKRCQGHTDSRVKCRSGNFVALLNFISWLTKSRVPRAHHTCETINKSTKATPTMKTAALCGTKFTRKSLLLHYAVLPKSNDSCYIDSFLFHKTYGMCGSICKKRMIIPK